MAVKEHPTLKVVSDAPTDLISGIDAFAIRNLQANPEDASKWLESKYPDLEFTVDGGEIYTKPKGQIAWEPVNTELLGVSPVSESDVLEMAASAPATFGGPAAQAAVAAGFDQARQQIANLMGMQEGISPGRTAAASALAAAAPFVGAAGVRGATKLGAKVSKKIPESVWKRFAENYDDLKGFVKSSADEAGPILRAIAQRTGEGFTSAWESVAKASRDAYEKAAQELGDVVPTGKFISDIQAAKKAGSKKIGASEVLSIIDERGESLLTEAQKSLGRRAKNVLEENIPKGALALSKGKTLIPSPLPIKKVSEEKAISFWSKMDEKSRKKVFSQLKKEGVDPTKNILALEDGALPLVQTYNVLVPEASGKQILDAANVLNSKVKFSDKPYDERTAEIISKTIGELKDTLKMGASPQTQVDLASSASALDRMSGVKDVLFSNTRAKEVDPDAAEAAIKNLQSLSMEDLVGQKVNAPQLVENLKDIFSSSADQTVLRTEDLLSAASPSMRPQLEKDLTGIAMRGVANEFGRSALLGGAGGVAGGYAGFEAAGYPGLAAGTLAGGSLGALGSPRAIRDYVIPAALLAEKAVGPKSSAWSRVPIIEATKSLQKGNASKTKED